MSIITGRRRKREKSYVTIENSMFEDSRLSWKAKGLLGYLLTKPDDWVVRISDLEKHGTDRERKIRAGLKELKDCGYLSYKRTRKDGKFSGVIWEYDDIPFEDDSDEITDEPDETIDIPDFPPHAQNSNMDDSPQRSFAHVENARVENAHVQNRLYINKTKTTTNTYSNKKENSSSLVSKVFAGMDSLDKNLKQQYPDVPFEEIKAKMLESADKGELNIYTGKQYVGALKYRIEDYIRSKRFPKAQFGSKKPVRTEYIPEGFNEPYKPNIEASNEDEIERKKMIIDLNLKKFRNEITDEEYELGMSLLK